MRMRYSYHWSTMSVLLITIVTSLISPSLATCESRCESSIPFVVQLKRIWSRSYSSSQTWERFLLILANTTDPSAASLRAQLLQAVGRFQDCVIACEHQFSKRNEKKTTEKRTTFKFLWIQ